MQLGWKIYIRVAIVGVIYLCTAGDLMETEALAR